MGPTDLFSQSILAISIALWAFATVPTVVFCQSPDPCSCSGGGFEIFAEFCQNETASANVTKIAKEEFGSVFEALDDDINTILASLVVTIIVVLVFAVAFQFNRADAARKERDEVEERRRELLKANAKIQEELDLNALSAEQTEMVQSEAARLQEEIPRRFLISHRGWWSC